MLKKQLYGWVKVEDGKPEKVLAKNEAKQLCGGLEDLYHQLFTDDSYTSVQLYIELYDSGIYACGTILATRKHFPKHIVFGSTRNTERGTCQLRYSSPFPAVIRLDNKPVYFLFTIHMLEFLTRAPQAAGEVRRGLLVQQVVYFLFPAHHS